MTVVCYKTKEPVIYNEGTRYEKRYDTFLAYYSYEQPSAAERAVEKLNTEHPAKLWNGEPIDWNFIDYFYVDEQEPMMD